MVNYTTEYALSPCTPFLQSSKPTELCLNFPSHFPWYYSPSPSLLAQASDSVLALIVPVACYWIASLFFHLLDLSEAPYVAKHRIHPSEDEKRRNLVSKLDVLKMVLFQQAIQTGLGVVALDEGKRVTVEQAFRGMQSWMVTLTPWINYSVDESVRGVVLVRTAYTFYWWIAPASQFFFAM